MDGCPVKRLLMVAGVLGICALLATNAPVVWAKLGELLSAVLEWVGLG